MLFGKMKCIYYMIKANKAYAADTPEEAANWLGRAYNTGAAKPTTVTTYGYLLLKQGRLDEAMEVFENQLRSNNTSNNEYYNIQSNYALGLWKQGKLDEAIAALEKIIPNYKTTNIYGSLGYLYNLKGNLDKALSFNLEALEYNNTNTVILDNLGQTYYLLGEQKKAEETYSRLMSLNPKFPEAYFDYALVLEKSGDRNKCIEMLKNAQKYKINYLSAVTKEDIDSKLAELEAC